MPGFIISPDVRGYNCQTDSFGSIILSALNGNGPYTFVWSNGATTHNLIKAPVGFYVVSVTDANGCIDTASATITCTGCSSIHASLNTNASTYCAGDSIYLTFSGAPFGKFIVNGQVVSPVINVAPDGFTTAQPLDQHNLGTNTICFVAYSANPDSTDVYCSDTACNTFIVQQCPCNALQAHFSASTDTGCVGDSIYFTFSGGPWGRFIADGKVEISHFSIIPAGKTFALYLDANSPGLHHACLVVYSADPGSSTTLDSATAVAICSDTVCLDIFIKSCNSCSAYAGQAVLKMAHLAGTTYQFQDVGGTEPNYVNWLVDGTAAGQLTGYGTFNYSFNVAGEHTICMQAVFIYTDSLGNNICCYQTACDSIDVDSCDFWKATAQITYQLDPNNYHNVTFYYAGNPNNLTIVWNFGDGASGISDGSPITHYYADSTWNVCAELIWSLGDTAVSHIDSGGVCCCVDTICESVVVAPCNAINFGIIQSNDGSGNPIYQVVPVSPNTHASANSAASATPQAGTLPAAGAAAQTASAFAGMPSGLNIISITWTVNHTVVQTGIGQIYGSPDVGAIGDVICVTVNYTITFDDGETDTCSTVVCDTVGANSAHASKGGLLSYFPNPANEILTVVVNASSAQSTGTIALLDNLGSPLLTKSLDNMTSGMQQTYLDLGKITPGLYMMRVTIDHHTQTVKVVKE